MKFVVMTVLALAGSAFAQQPHSTPTAECNVIAAGTKQSQQTEPMSSGGARAYATITASRPADDKDARHCHVSYALLFSEAGQPYKTVATFEEDGRDAFGVELIGFSPDNSKVAANFWYAAGDYTDIRPALYDRTTNKSVVKELSDEIIGSLTDCNYTPTVAGITNAGEAVVRVAKNTYVEEGCSDPGDLLFNVRTGEVRHATKTAAASAP